MLVLHQNQQHHEKSQYVKQLATICCCAAVLACPQLLSLPRILLGHIQQFGVIDDMLVDVRAFFLDADKTPIILNVIHDVLNDVSAFFLDVNKNPIVLPVILMAHWLWHAWNKWEKHSLVILFCLSAVVFIEHYSHAPPEQSSSTFQHVFRGLQKSFLSVILLQLWMHISVYLVLIAHRGIGRQFYYIQKTLSNVVVVTYFLFIFIMYFSPQPMLPLLRPTAILHASNPPLGPGPSQWRTTSVSPNGRIWATITSSSHSGSASITS